MTETIDGRTYFDMGHIERIADELGIPRPAGGSVEAYRAAYGPPLPDSDREDYGGGEDRFNAEREAPIMERMRALYLGGEES